MNFKIEKLEDYLDSFKEGHSNPHTERKIIDDIIEIKFKIPYIEKEETTKKLKKLVTSYLNCPQAKKYEQYIKELELKFERQIKLQEETKKQREESKNNNLKTKYLYDLLMPFCNDTVNNFHCSCENFKFFPIDIYSCEQKYSKKCEKYDCYVLPFMYFLKRADRHCSELIYAFKSAEKILKQMSQYNILELGCGPAMSLIAMNYYNKNNKRINYEGIDNNPRWVPIHNKIKEYINDNKLPYEFNISEGDITEKINISFKPNIIILNYVISWFYEGEKIKEIEKLYKNVADIIDINQPTIIIINDVNEDKKGVGVIEDIIKVISEKTKKYSSIKQSFYVSPNNPIKKTEYIVYGKDYEKGKETNTILRQGGRFDYWKKIFGQEHENICTSAQLIITIGGKDDN